MIAIVAIAIASGAASALMFASVKSGALISLVLFNLAPLPLMVAAIGWGPLTAAMGGIVLDSLGAMALSLIGGPLVALSLLIWRHVPEGERELIEIPPPDSV